MRNSGKSAMDGMRPRAAIKGGKTGEKGSVEDGRKIQSRLQA